MMFKIVILSASASNLVPCIQAILAHEPELPLDHIIVVDDGARSEAEPKLPGLCWVEGIKPFIYARNANIGIRKAETDVILLNDDARLISSQGFTKLSLAMQRHQNIGVCSAGITGVIGNPRQIATSHFEMRIESQTLAFVCVYIPKHVYDRVGFLDERFVGYGFDDNDYCMRVLAVGLQLGIYDPCVVDHGGELPSTFRSRPDISMLFTQNKKLFSEKLEERPLSTPAVITERRVDLLYLACNRLEFTRETFSTMIATTDWHYVRELYVYDDGSVDGTYEWLEQNVNRVPAPFRFIKTRFGSPVTAMNHFIESSSSPILAKTDNDAMLPPGWLRQSLDVLDRHPELMLLGIEAMYPHQNGENLVRSFIPSDYISGLGLYRRDVFVHSRPVPYNKYFGLEEWQAAQGKRLTKGWINPALPVFLLDRCPLEPWKSYSDRYIQSGWQRPWQRYDLSCTLWEWAWSEHQTINQLASTLNNSLKLNIGYYVTPQEGFSNISMVEVPGADVVDLKKPWPWEDNSVNYIRANDVIEHLPDKIFTMNELWRLAQDGGTLEITVPTTEGSGAFQDPTHVSYWNRRSFLYYEAGNPYRERFAKRYGISAKFRVVREHIDKTVDGPRLTMILEALKGKSKTLPTGDARFLCAMRVKNESKYIAEVITSVLPLCQNILVFDDHSNDETSEICRSFGERVQVFSSPFQGLDEARDKNYLLNKVIEVGPEWVLWIDGDEVLERSGPTRMIAAADKSSGVTAFSLHVAYVWNDSQHIRVDGIYGRFARPSFFRLKGQTVSRLQFPATKRGGNFHCGNIPQGLTGRVRELDVRLKHYGYMTQEQRQSKYCWYTTIDPGNESEDQYRHLIGSHHSRYAPGPPQIIPWVE